MLVIKPSPPKDSIGSFNLLPSPLQLLLLPLLMDFSLCGKVRDSVLLDDLMLAWILLAYLTTMMRAAGRHATIIPTVTSTTVQTATA